MITRFRFYNSGSFKIELKQLKYLITQLFWIYKSDNKVASGRNLKIIIMIVKSIKYSSNNF